MKHHHFPGVERQRQVKVSNATRSDLCKARERFVQTIEKTIEETTQGAARFAWWIHAQRFRTRC